MEIATIAIAATGLVVVGHVYEWAKLRRMSPEERRIYKKKTRLRAAARERLPSVREAREKRLEQERKLAIERHRDADVQETPFEYQIGRHANEALAIRYGIANQKRQVIEGFYYAKGGKKIRDPDRDKYRYVPASSILARKLEKVGNDKYRVTLPIFGNREAIAVIEIGTDYLKTFLPMDDDWFAKHGQLEEVLKGNGSFSLKELARFHVEKAVS